MDLDKAKGVAVGDNGRSLGDSMVNYGKESTAIPTSVETNKEGNLNESNRNDEEDVEKKGGHYCDRGKTSTDGAGWAGGDW